MNVKLSDMSTKERKAYEQSKTDKKAKTKRDDGIRDAAMKKQLSHRTSEKKKYKKTQAKVKLRTYEHDGMVIVLGGTLPALSPDEIIKKAIAYFQWNEANPIVTEEHAIYMGGANGYEVYKARPLTITRCVLFLGISYETWSNYRKREALQAEDKQCDDDGAEYTAAINWVEGIIRSQKFEGAAAGIFNPMIICRELGLKDNTKVVTDDGEGGDAPVVGHPVMFLPQNGREAGEVNEAEL